jgi:membrane protein DedA with SNARE-associated domain
VKYGGVLVVIARFIVGLREFNGIIAGVTGMPARRFLIYNGLGAAVWVAVWVSAGYLAGDHINAIYRNATRYSAYVLTAVVVLVVAYVGWRVWRSRRRRGLSAAPEADAGAPPG